MYVSHLFSPSHPLSFLLSLLSFLPFLFIFWDKVSCSWHWPWTCYIVQTLGLPRFSDTHWMTGGHIMQFCGAGDWTVPRFPYPFICWQTLQLAPLLSCCEQSCSDVFLLCYLGDLWAHTTVLYFFPVFQLKNLLHYSSVFCITLFYPNGPKESNVRLSVHMIRVPGTIVNTMPRVDLTVHTSQ